MSLQLLTGLKTKAQLLKQSPKYSEWITFRQPEGAFSIKLPAKPELISKEIENDIEKDAPGYFMKIYHTSDEVNKVSYLIRYNDFPNGFYLADKQKIYDIFKNDLAKKGEIISGPQPFKENGIDGVEVRLMLNSKFYCICRIFTRGSRVFLLMRQNQLERTRLVIPDNFFNSFSFLPYQEAKLSLFQSEGETFKVLVPQKPRIIKTPENDYDSFLETKVRLAFTNPNSGGAYILEKCKVKDYFRIKDADSLYSFMISGYTKGSDSVYGIKDVKFNGYKGREFLVKSKDFDLINRFRMWMDGENFMFLNSIITQDEIAGSTNNAILNSYSNSTTTTIPDFSSSKAKLILKDLASPDTSIAYSAKGALSYYDFRKDELPDIYKALAVPYKDDTSRNGVKISLIEGLTTVSDSSALPVLTKLYQNSTGLDQIKAAILGVLPKIDSINGYNTYLKFLTDKPLENLEFNTWRVFSPLSDSLDFFKAHFDQLLPLLKYPVYRSPLLSKIDYLITADEGKHVSDVQPYYKKIMSYANEDLEKYLSDLKNGKDSVHFNWSVYSYLSIMQELGSNPLVDPFTTKLIRMDPDGENTAEAVNARIMNKLKLDEKLKLKFLDSLDTRMRMMEVYSKVGQLDRVPAKYKTQDEFARLCLYSDLAEEEDIPAEIQLLGDFLVSDTAYYAFKVKYTYDGEEKSYIGVAGGHKQGSSDLDFKNYMTYFAWEEIQEDWKQQALKLIEGTE